MAKVAEVQENQCAPCPTELKMSESLQKLSDCVVHLQGEELPACSQILGLQSELLADMLQNSKLELDKDGRKIVPFADNEPAMVRLIKILHTPCRQKKKMLSDLSLTDVARVLSLAQKYRFQDIAWRLLEDLCNPSQPTQPSM